MSWRSSYLFCPVCFNVYFANQITPMWENGKPYMYCPSAMCGAHKELATIDELMIKPIQNLNIKGYRTQYCCSGHERRRTYDRRGYILFDKKVKLTSLPELWEKDKLCINGTCIRSTTADLALSMKNLNEWVDGLEDLKGEKDQDDFRQN